MGDGVSIMQLQEPPNVLHPLFVEFERMERHVPPHGWTRKDEREYQQYLAYFTLDRRYGKASA